MMFTDSTEAGYLWDQIRNHVRLFFPRNVNDIVEQTEVYFIPYNDALSINKPAIVAPIDIEAPLKPSQPYSVGFNGTFLTLWNRLPFPGGRDWECLPNAQTPLWYVNAAGTLMPAYNLFGNLMDLLTLRAERENPARDRHGRCFAQADPRYALGLLQVPAFNEGVAALVDACIGMATRTPPKFRLEDSPPSVSLVLSHDCDILLGNDIVTQSVRFVRIFLPLLNARAPETANLGWILGNMVDPRNFYLNDIPGMIEVERESGFQSSFYMLNGSRGRFGARSGHNAILETAPYIPEDWNIGMHYNYNTFGNSLKFASQKFALERLLGISITSGRAHYLRFDPCNSWRFWAEHGIRCDESVGYPDYVGYRCGIAGAFKPFDSITGKELNIWEAPMTVMDEALITQYPEDPIAGCRKLVRHLTAIGGALSVLFHPGTLNNPEFPELIGAYPALLKAVAPQISSGVSAPALVDRLSQ